MEALLSQAWREKSLVLLMADAVPQTERRTPRRVGNMVVVAVGCELVSASKFPANRENNREFCRIRPSVAIFVPNEPRCFNSLQRNSLCNRTGNFQTCIRENFSRNRESV